jgi:epoxyqueuosine reductase
LVNADAIADLKADLKAEAARLGFADCGIAPASDDPLVAARLDEWLADGLHGEMEWMAERADQRADPQTLWSRVRSVIMLGVNYGPDSDPLETLSQRDRGTISVYARNRDYHDIIKGRLKEIAGLLEARTGEKVKVFVDTAPVMEKPLAEAAGLGWQGKHTVLVSREFGSWLFLGAIYADLPFEADGPVETTCGSCRACHAACPTDAFTAAYRIDARRCISYLTIENKGPIPEEFRKALGNRIYGCDDCLAVCPWNKFASVSREAKLKARDDLNAPALDQLAELDDRGFRVLFSGSPIKRIGHARFLRNVLIAIGNSGDAELLPLAKARLTHQDAVVRGAAVWAVRRLDAEKAERLALDFLPRESDTAVRTEWVQDL